MAESLLLALLETSQNPAVQAANDDNLMDKYNEWVKVDPQRQELMMRVLYDVLHHSVMMGIGGHITGAGGGAATLGTVLARIMTRDMKQDDQRHALEGFVRTLRTQMKQEIADNLKRLRGDP